MTNGPLPETTAPESRKDSFISLRWWWQKWVIVWDFRPKTSLLPPWPFCNKFLTFLQQVFPYLYLDIHNILRHISRIIVKMSSTCQGISWDSPIRWMSHRLSPRRSRCSRSFRPPTTLVPPTIEKPGSALGEHGDRAQKHNTQLLVYSVYSVYINDYKSLKHDYVIQCIYVLNMFEWSYS